MNYNSDSTLQQFVRRFLGLNGAVMEQGPDGLEAILPEHLAARLNTPEYLHIATGENAQEQFSVHYGSPLLEKMVDAACDTAIKFWLLAAAKSRASTGSRTCWGSSPGAGAFR